MSLHASVSAAKPDAFAKLAFVDMLRGVAILLVVLTHTAQGVPGLSWVASLFAAYGQMGVQLFFLMSAFTLTHSWYGRISEPGKSGSFYLRRIFRIAPMYCVGIVVYTLLSFRSGHPVAADGILFNLLLLHGLVPSAMNAVVPGGWSIGTEMVFYALFPLLIMLFGTMRRFCLLALALFLVVLSGVVLVVLLDLNRRFGISIQNGTAAYFSIFTQLPVFVSGMIFWSYWKLERSARIDLLLAAFGMTAALTISLALWNNDTAGVFIGINLLTSAVFFGLAVLAVRFDPHGSFFLCSVGRRSYSIYIIHFIFALMLTRPLCAPLSQLVGSEAALLIVFLINAVASFLVALVTERFIEGPGIRLGKTIVRRYQSLFPRVISQ